MSQTMTNHDKKQQLTQIATVVRALVTSRKPPCFIGDILDDYPEVEGEQLPYKKLGFSSAQALLEETEEFIFDRIGKQVTITTKLNLKSAHVSTLVLDQKRSVKSSVGRLSAKPSGAPKRAPFRPHYQPRAPFRQHYQSNGHPKRAPFRQQYQPIGHPPPAAFRQQYQHQRTGNKTLNVLLKFPPHSSEADNKDYKENNPDDSAKPNWNKRQPQQQQEVKQQNSVYGSGPNDIKDLREKLNSKLEQQPQESNAKAPAINQRKREPLQPQQPQNITFGDYFDLREYLDAKALQQQSQPENKPQHTRPSLDIATNSKREPLQPQQPQNITIGDYFDLREYLDAKALQQQSQPENKPQHTRPSLDIATNSKYNPPETSQVLPPCPLTDSELIDKLYEVLLTHRNGYFAKSIPALLEKTLKLTLPKHWWSLVSTSNKFKLETSAINVIVYANTDADDRASGPMNNIILPWTDKYWYLYITHCVSSVEIWAWLFGSEYNVKYVELVSDIKSHMETKKARPMSIDHKQIYLVFTSGDWQRVRVDKFDKLKNMAMCFYIDDGDSDWLPATSLYKCEPEFLHLPGQAVAFSLFGLEDFAGNPHARRHLEATLTHKAVACEIPMKPSNLSVTPSHPCCKIQVVLYDTSSPDEDINLNTLLLSKISNDTPLPTLNTRYLTNALVTHITDSGDLYLKLLGPDVEYLQKLTQDIIKSKFMVGLHRITRDDLQRCNVFLICENIGSSEQPLWHRGGLAGAKFNIDDDHFMIFFIDVGKTQRVHISKIFRLEALSCVLSKFPPQAVKVRLFNVPDCNELIIARMRSLLPTNCEAMVKLKVNGDVPLVTVYRYLEKTEVLHNINNAIRTETELSLSAAQNVGEGDAKLSSTRSTKPSFADMVRNITRTSARTSSQSELPALKLYEGIPEVGQKFGVYISKSASPSNFNIQPKKALPELKKLMQQLQDYCQKNGEVLTIASIKIGEAYAAKNADGVYFRAIVVAIHNFAEMVQVSFCDVGNSMVLSIDDLKMLPTKFRQLPKLAIQAKLHGIMARNGEWSPEICSIFRSWTFGQVFVSTVRKIFYDESCSPPVRTLELELIDEFSGQNLLVHEVLLMKGCGMPVVQK